MITTYRPDEDPEYIPAPAAEQPPPLSEYPDGPTLADMESAVVPMASCAYCGATRPLAELEYAHVWHNGIPTHRFFCHERSHAQQFNPDCANRFEAGGEG